MDDADHPFALVTKILAARHPRPEARSLARRIVAAASQDDVEVWARRVAAGEPLQHVMGKAAFWTLDLAVTPDVLIPRPETEHVVEALLANAPAQARILDFGVGSGAIVLSLLSELPRATGLGLDVSPAALAIAQANAAAHGFAARCAFLAGHWDTPLGPLADGAFHRIAANPPYIPTADIVGLDTAVRDHDPRLALDGGADGLTAYRALAPAITRLLAPGGRAALEVGAGQAADVAALFTNEQVSLCQIVPDLAGIDRVVVITRDF